MTPEDVRRKLDADLKQAFPDAQITTTYGFENSLNFHIEGELTIREIGQLHDMAIKADEALYDIEEAA